MARPVQRQARRLLRVAAKPPKGSAPRAAPTVADPMAEAAVAETQALQGRVHCTLSSLVRRHRQVQVADQAQVLVVAVHQRVLPHRLHRRLARLLRVPRPGPVRVLLRQRCEVTANV